MQIRSKSVLAAATLLCLAAGASASVSQYCFTVVARSGAETATFQVLSEDMYTTGVEGEYLWELSSPYQLRSQNDVLLGTLTSGRVSYIEDPVVSINFAVTAGNVMTAFDVSSVQLGFATISNGIADAVAGISSDDLSGNFNVTVGPSGTFPGNTIYAARYNNTATLDGTDFGGGLLVGPYNHPFVISDSGSIPSAMIPGNVNNIQAGFRFTLSEGDQASGTSTFTIVIPAPGAAGLLGLAGLLVARRRR